MPNGNLQLKQNRIDAGFLIEDETTYQEIADYLYESDPAGVSDLIYCLIEKNPSLKDVILSWTL